MRTLLFKLIVPLHVRLYGLTGGHIGGRLFDGSRVILLMTIGRKTGQPRVTPLVYLRQGDAYLVAGGAAGIQRHPGWYWNAISNPVSIQVMGQVFPVSVREAQGVERATIEQRFMQANPRFIRYTAQANRVIPMLILREQ